MTQLLKRAGIYVLTHRESRKHYTGKDNHLGKRAEQHLSLKVPGCRDIHNAIKEHGRDAFDVELIHYPNISEDTLYEVEKWKIKQLGSHVSQGGYNGTWGGDGFDSETAREVNLKHSRENNLKRVANGTHHFLGGEIQRKRLEDGTHHFLDSEFARENARRRVEEGTHPFLGGEIAREVSRKRSEEGTHHFLGKNNPSHRRVKDGTHNFLGGEIGGKNSRKRVKDGTHNFQDPQFYRKRSYAKRIKAKNHAASFIVGCRLS